MSSTTGSMHALISGEIGKQYAFVPTGKNILPQISPLLLIGGAVTEKYANSRDYLGVIQENQEMGNAVIESIAVNDPEFSYIEYDPERTREYTLNGGLTTSTGQMVFDEEITDVRPDELFMSAETQEIVRVSGTVDKANKTIPISRAYSSTGVVTSHEAAETLTQDSATTITDGTKFIRLGPATEEGSFSRYSDRKKATRRKGHTHIIRQDLIRTGTQLAQEGTYQIPEETYEANKIELCAELLKDHEYLAFFSKLHRATTSGEVVRTTRGLFNAITTNVTAASALTGGTNAFTVDKAEEMIYLANKRVMPGASGSEAPIFLVGYTAFNKIASVYSKQTNLRQNVDSGTKVRYGLALDKVIAPFGPEGTMFVYYPLLDTAGVSSEVVQLNPLFFKLVSLAGRDLKWTDDSQPNDYDGKAGYWLAEMGALVLHEQMHGRYTGFDWTA